MPKLQLPYEITKLSDEEKAIDEINYARFIQANFDTIIKYINATDVSIEKDTYTYDFAVDDGNWTLSDATISGGILDITANSGYGQRSPDDNWYSDVEHDFRLEADFKNDAVDATPTIAIKLNGDTNQIRFDVYDNLMRIVYAAVVKTSQAFTDDTSSHTMKVRRLGTTYHYSIDSGIEISWNYETARALENIQLKMWITTGEFDNFKYCWTS